MVRGGGKRSSKSRKVGSLKMEIVGSGPFQISHCKPKSSEAMTHACLSVCVCSTENF